MTLCGISGRTCEQLCGDRRPLCGLWRVAWFGGGNLAALYLWDEREQTGVLWTNRDHVHGRLEPLIWRWAQQRIWTGQLSAVLPLSALERLPLDVLGQAG